MVKDHSDSEETPCRHMGYSFRLTARVLLYAPSHRQDSTYHSLCYTSRGALAGTRNSSMGPPHEGLIRQCIAPWANTLTTELHLAPTIEGIKGPGRSLHPHLSIYISMSLSLSLSLTTNLLAQTHIPADTCTMYPWQVCAVGVITPNQIPLTTTVAYLYKK